jgi:hypothetical protein
VCVKRLLLNILEAGQRVLNFLLKGDYHNKARIQKDPEYVNIFFNFNNFFYERRELGAHPSFNFK